MSNEHKSPLRVALAVLALGAAACSSTAPTDANPDAVAPTIGSDGVLAPGVVHNVDINLHCGARQLSRPINDQFWIADEAAGGRSWQPDEWTDALKRGQDLVTVEVLLSNDAELTVTLANRPVIYRPVAEDDQLFDCA